MRVFIDDKLPAFFFKANERPGVGGSCFLGFGCRLLLHFLARGWDLLAEAPLALGALLVRSVVTACAEVVVSSVYERGVGAGCRGLRGIGGRGVGCWKMAGC